MPKLNLGFDAAGREKKSKNKKKNRRRLPDPEIEVRINRGQVLMFANETPQSILRSAQEPAIKYIGKFLYRTNYALTVGVYTEMNEEVEYEEDDIVLMTYIEQKSLFFFSARINSIREASADSLSDRFEIEYAKPKTDGNQDSPGYGYDKYIFEIIPITVPEKQQRREFFRMSLAVDVYYKILKTETEDEAETERESEPEEESVSLVNLTYKELQYELDHARDGDDGYIKLRTMDLSAGGFRAKSKTVIEPGSVMECMIVVGFEACPAMVKILSAKKDEKSGLYDIRAIFFDMSDQIRDRIVKYIFAQQRQIQARHNIRKQQEDENKNKR